MVYVRCPANRHSRGLGETRREYLCSFAPTARPTGGFRADYGFVGTLDAEIRCDLDREIGYGITDDTDEIYVRLDDTQDDRSLISGQLNLLRRDRRSHARTTRLIKSEARASHEAWVQSMDASDMTRSEVRALRTTVLAHQTEIRDLWAADRRRQAQLIEALTLMSTLQTQMVALQRQQIPARDLAHLDVQEEADSMHEWSCMVFDLDHLDNMRLLRYGHVERYIEWLLHGVYLVKIDVRMSFE
ncbi:hypothetical protein Tco_0729773 [Tanacetum coccineum]|uniref:Uncharacterized protein n=1 Tax=Tanacetum coccineum TaxID=301880 RepID=A0ABQ4YQQ8_9ASTR